MSSRDQGCPAESQNAKTFISIMGGFRGYWGDRPP